MSKVIKKIAPIALPIVGNILAPGIGGALGGALGGAVSGGGLKSALLGAAGGGLAGYAPALTGAGGVGLSGTAGTVATNALRGAGYGLSGGGDLKSALAGAALGGVAGLGSSILSGSSIPGIGSIGSGSTLSESGVPIPGIKPTGILGGVTKSAGSTGLFGGGGESALTGGGNGMLGDVLKAGAGIYSYGQNQNTSEDIQRMLEQAQGKAINTYSPYLQAGQQGLSALQEGFQAGDLTQDPGYQFQLSQGQQAIDRGLAAQGMSQSGVALKRALEYSQGLADQTYNQAYNRYLSQNQPLASLGYGAASNTANLYGDIGGIQALTRAQQQQSQDQLLANLLGG